MKILRVHDKLFAIYFSIILFFIPVKTTNIKRYKTIGCKYYRTYSIQICLQFSKICFSVILLPVWNKGYQTEKEKEHEFKLYGHPGADL